MKNRYLEILTPLCEEHMLALEPQYQGRIEEKSYPVYNYINKERMLVTNQKLETGISEIKTMELNSLEINVLEIETTVGCEITKKCNVYLPADYDNMKNQNQYNLLILLHGVGGDRNEWIDGSGSRDNRSVILNMLDNLIAMKLIEPLIVVFPEGRSSHDWTDCSFTPDGTNMLGFYYFDYELRYDLLPFLENEYSLKVHSKEEELMKCLATRKYRAIAGLSMGGMQSLNMVLGGQRCDSILRTGHSSPWNNGLDYVKGNTPGLLDLFSAVGAFSNAPTSSEGKVLGEYISNSPFSLPVLYIACGSEDGIAYGMGCLKATDQLYESANGKIDDYFEIVVEGGKHDFGVWNQSIFQFLQLIFK